MVELLDSLGIKYEYQLPVRSGFVLDFAFPEVMKAIEVDGFWHRYNKEHDKARDEVLRRGGWTILRLKAKQLEDESAIRELVLGFLI